MNILSVLNTSVSFRLVHHVFFLHLQFFLFVFKVIVKSVVVLHYVEKYFKIFCPPYLYARRTQNNRNTSEYLGGHDFDFIIENYSKSKA